MMDESDENGENGERDENVVPLAARPKAACPTCGRPATTRYRPFCSGRCADVDLGRWFSGRYRIPSEEVPPDGTPPEDEDT